jgi:glutamine synthetase
MPGQLEF